MQRTVIISDTQIEYHDPISLRNVIEFIHAWQPTEVVHIGDLMDYPQPSRWSKDTKAEYEGSIYADSETGKRVLAKLRQGYDGPVKVIEGNHDLRPRDYLAKYAPALAESRDFTLDKLLDFDGFGIDLIEGFYDFAPGWVMTHGHLGFTLSQLAGRTALLAAKRLGKNVVMGHTHKLGLTGESYGYNGELDTFWGMEVGHLCDPKKMGYLAKKGGYANWQRGFGIVFANGESVTPVPVMVHNDRTFTVDGYTFGRSAA